MAQERKVYNYRNWHEGAAGVACLLSLMVLPVIPSEIHSFHPKQIGAIEFFLIGPCLWGFFALLLYMSLRFWNEKIVFDGDSVTWYDRLGRVRCRARASGIKRIDQVGVMTGQGWAVQTDEGPIRFDCRINRHQELHNRFCSLAKSAKSNEF